MARAWTAVIELLPSRGARLRASAPRCFAAADCRLSLPSRAPGWCWRGALALECVSARGVGPNLQRGERCASGLTRRRSQRRERAQHRRSSAGRNIMAPPKAKHLLVESASARQAEALNVAPDEKLSKGSKVGRLPSCGWRAIGGRNRVCAHTPHAARRSPPDARTPRASDAATRGAPRGLRDPTPATRVSRRSGSRARARAPGSRARSRRWTAPQRRCTS